MLSDDLRQAIRDSGLSLYRIAKDAKVPYSAVHDFATNEDRDIGLRYAGPVAAVLGLSLQPNTSAGKPVEATRRPAKTKRQPKATSKSRPSPRPRGASVARVRGFVDAYGAANDVGGIVGQLPRNHSKRKAIATMLWAYRNEAGLRAWRRKGEYR